MSDSIDRVFAHALSTVRKMPHTGSARPPTSHRLALYGLYKQSMEGDVEGVMERPAGTSVEEQAEAEKWDAWHRCEGLSRAAAKRRYIAQLIQTMHKYAASTPEAKALVEELEFVWNQVRGKWSGGEGDLDGGDVDAQDAEGAQYAGDVKHAQRAGHSGSRQQAGSGSGLKIVKPMSDNDAASLPPPSEEDPQDFEDARSSTSASRGEYEEETEQKDWKQRVSRALVQLTAEVSALRELADGSSTSTLGRYFARGRKRRRRWFVKVWFLLWGVAKRVLVDAAVVAVVILVLRWKWRERVESWWELLGVWMGFLSDEVRVKLRQGMREGLKMSRGVKMLAGNASAGKGGERE